MHFYDYLHPRHSDSLIFDNISGIGMKLVCRYEGEVKLYAQELSYERLLEFVGREFGLEGGSLEISFTDEEGDAIAVASEDDMLILESYFADKAYVKLNVKGRKREDRVENDERDGEKM